MLGQNSADTGTAVTFCLHSIRRAGVRSALLAQPRVSAWNISSCRVSATPSD